MFGYLTPDTKNMYEIDFNRYKAFYCGLCHTSGRVSSRLMKLGVSYDITLINILLHSVLDVEVELVEHRCIKHPMKKQIMVKENHLSELTALLNVLLIDYKLKDDNLDNPNFKTKTAKLLLAPSIKVARKKLPEIAQLIDIARAKQTEIEKKNIDSIDSPAHPTANMLREIFRVICKDKYTKELGELVYQLSRFIYIADSIDDYDKDFQSGQYNPFVNIYGVCSKKKLLNSHREDVEFTIKSTYSMISEVYKKIEYKQNEGILTHMMWYGLDNTIGKVLEVIDVK